MKKVEISLHRPTDEEALALMKSVLMSQSPVVDPMLSWSRLPRVVGAVIMVYLVVLMVYGTEHPQPRRDPHQRELPVLSKYTIGRAKCNARSALTGSISSCTLD